jgi:hypothetical protein
MLTTPPQTTTRIDEFITGIMITSRVKKNFINLTHGIIGLLLLVTLLLCLIPVEVALIQDYQNQRLSAILLIAALLVIGAFGFIRFLKEIREILASNETIEIDGSGVRIEKSGIFKSRQTIPAERIRGITPAPTFPAVGGFLGFLRNTSHTGSIWIWTTTRLKYPIMVGSGLSYNDAMLFLGKIWIRYPQYRFNQTMDDRQAETR